MQIAAASKKMLLSQTGNSDDSHSQLPSIALQASAVIAGAHRHAVMVIVDALPVVLKCRGEGSFRAGLQFCQ